MVSDVVIGIGGLSIPITVNTPLCLWEAKHPFLSGLSRGICMSIHIFKLLLETHLNCAQEVNYNHFEQFQLICVLFVPFFIKIRIYP